MKKQIVKKIEQIRQKPGNKTKQKSMMNEKNVEGKKKKKKKKKKSNKKHEEKKKKKKSME